MSRSSIRWPLTIVITALGLALAGFFAALGIWQVERLGWKTDLIARVEARVDADPVPAPGPGDWAAITRENAEYRRVSLTGTFLNEDEIQIYVPSDFGPSYWVLTPLQRDDGTIVMINRGLVTEELRDPATRTAPEGPQTVTGLLRITEDRGWLFSQDNRPEDDAWYRRDIAAITEAKGLSPAAPYFVDQDEVDPRGWPRGGRTVVSFRNHHLQYALTWFGLVILVIGGWVLFIRHERNR